MVDVAFWPFRISVSLLLAWAREATDRTAVVYCLAHPEHVPDTAQQVQGPNWSGKSYKNLQQGMLHCCMPTCWCKQIFHISYRKLGEVNGNDSASNSSGKDMGLVTHKSNCSLGEAMKRQGNTWTFFLSTIALHWSYQQFVILYHMNHIVIKLCPSKSVISLWKNKDKHGKAGFWMSSRQDREKWRMTIWRAKHCKLPFYEGISLRRFLRAKWSAIPGHTHEERDTKKDCCNKVLHVVPCYQFFSLSIGIFWMQKKLNREINGKF